MAVVPVNKGIFAGIGTDDIVGCFSVLFRLFGGIVSPIFPQVFPHV